MSLKTSILFFLGTVFLFFSQSCQKKSDLLPTANAKKVKVFILVGDDSVLEHGRIAGQSSGKHQDFYANPKPVKGEKRKFVKYEVYELKNEYLSKPKIEGIIEIGDQRTRRISKKQRGRVAIEMEPFPPMAFKEGHMTTLKGFISVKSKGLYELRAGEGESVYNRTYLEGKEVYTFEKGMKKAKVKAVELSPKKRYAFQTNYFGKPSHAFRVPMILKPGTLETVVSQNEKYAFLKNKEGKWIERNDVVLYDAHPIHNNTEAPSRPLKVATLVGGPEGGQKMGVDLMMGHKLGDAFDESVMIFRFGTRHPIWFRRGSRSLAHDYRPPSSGGGDDHQGSWDVIHFNFGVWDATYRDASSKYFSGHNITSVSDFEKNLRVLVKKMKKTGATIIWGAVTPVWKGEPGRVNADEDAYNRVAAKVMKEEGVIINDLNAEVKRMGYPKSNNVHSVGNLATKVTATITEALKNRKNPSKPLPRVLLIGDSITGSYQSTVMKNFDGIAAVFKNPGNAEDTWNGLERIDDWLDLKKYLLNGQSYLELVDSLQKSLGEELNRVLPNDDKKGVELAGLVWFQGISDAGSEPKANAYEKNLVNLINDLRKETNIPKLPVVVVGIGKAGSDMNKTEETVFKAQMAVSNSNKYPEFKRSVISIDTRKACKPLSNSPGGRDRFKGNAESYLQIGEMIGDALLKLISSD